MTAKQMTSEEVLIDLQDYAKKPQGYVIFHGKNGRGKSYAAMKIYEKCTPYALPAYDHDWALFINQADLNMAFIDSYEKYGNASLLLKKCYATRLLVLDDLGTRTPSTAFADFLYAVIDKRWNERDKKGTIITTNLDSTRIRKDFSDAAFSRMASGRNYIFTGPDRRFNEIGF